MATIMLEVAAQVAVLFEESAALIVVRWFRFGDHDTFTRSLDVQAGLVEAGRARFIVVDIAEATGTPSAMDHDYVNRFVYPRYRRGGLKAIVTVIPHSARTRMGTKGWNRSGRTWRFDMHEAATVQDARELLERTYPAVAAS
ncbi:MAG: hypothetical protein HY830_15260 [Actinobacteria bacterium]|nr:hypothetical protein [Actinomycetota bacterium]